MALKMQGNFYNDAVIDPYMLERAEVMRGPVSVLYGKSSPGGLLNMVSKRPTTEPLKEIQFKMVLTVCSRLVLTSATRWMKRAYIRIV